MELSFFKKSIPTLSGVGLLFIVMVFIGYWLLTPIEKLPIYNNW